jgi:predicted Fe-S protein YdhL (DUF1289 family)
MAMPTVKFEELESSMDVASPCTGVCTLDLMDVCRGCHRTKNEISEWIFLSSSEKQQIVDKLKWVNPTGRVSRTW